MATLRYITHPEVAVDPSVPVPNWDLSEVGFQRAQLLLTRPWIGDIAAVVSSAERKAKTTAAILADHLGVTVDVRPATGENDRSATGFVPPSEFERLADAFFSWPDQSISGWERAVDAQARIVAELSDLLTPARATGDIAVIGHGGVGTLLYCHLAGLKISRQHDQPGQGHYFSVDIETGRPLHHWRTIDEI